MRKGHSSKNLEIARSLSHWRSVSESDSPIDNMVRAGYFGLDSKNWNHEKDPVYQKINSLYGQSIFSEDFHKELLKYQKQIEGRQMPQETYEWLLNTSLESLKLRFWMEYKARKKEKV